MLSRFRVLQPGEGDIYWYVIDSTLPKLNGQGQIIALCYSHSYAYRVVVALNNMANVKEVK